MKAIIPTGGRGTRMRPITFSANKHFIPVANKPLILYPIQTVADAGIKEIGITYNPGGLEEAQNLLGDGSKWGVKITYVLQEKPAGLANIVQVCEDFVAGDAFVLHLGDNIFVDGIAEAVEHFEKEKPNGMVTMVHHPENRRMGVPYFDDQGRLLKYVEKPENPPHDFAVPGLYFADNNFFKCFKEDPIQPSPRGEYEIPDAFQWMINHNYRVDVLEYKGKWLDPGKFDDWLEANQFLIGRLEESKLESQPDEQSRVENRVSIGKDCTIENTHIRGPVIIGTNVTLKNAYIGPYCAVSDGCTITGSHVENSVVMNNVKIANVSQPIDESIIGIDSIIEGRNHIIRKFKLFVGEKTLIEM